MGCGENLEVVNRQLRECRMWHRRVKGPDEVHSRWACQFSRGTRATQEKGGTTRSSTSDGYDEKTKGYKLVDLISKIVIVSRDVRVNEQENETGTIRRKSISKLENHQSLHQQTQKFPMMKMNHDNPKCEVCEICTTQQMRYTLYVFWQMLKISALKRRCETRSGKLPWMRRLKWSIATTHGKW